MGFCKLWIYGNLEGKIFFFNILIYVFVRKGDFKISFFIIFKNGRYCYDCRLLLVLLSLFFFLYFFLLVVVFVLDFYIVWEGMLYVYDEGMINGDYVFIIFEFD